jgi:hypothetical protein
MEIKLGKKARGEGRGEGHVTAWVDVRIKIVWTG